MLPKTVPDKVTDSQICDCQNSINDKFVLDNVCDQMLISRHDYDMSGILADVLRYKKSCPQTNVCEYLL